MREKYILWDFDGTLAYRDGMWSKSICDLLLENGQEGITAEDIHPFMTVGFPWHVPEQSHKEFFGGISWWDHMTNHFLGILLEMGVEQNRAKKVASGIRRKYLDLTKWSLFDDTVSALEKAESLGYKNIILSNHVPELSCLVRGLGIESHFIKVYCSADLGYEKPNLHLYKKVLELLGNPQTVTMVGDNYTADVDGALGAGIEGILVRTENIYGYPRYSKDLAGVFDLLQLVS